MKREPTWAINKRGVDILHDPVINKSTACTEA
jgi:hypothetical protein